MKVKKKIAELEISTEQAAELAKACEAVTHYYQNGEYISFYDALNLLLSENSLSAFFEQRDILTLYPQDTFLAEAEKIISSK